MRLPRQPVAVVFDMDGLLFDTERLYEEAAIAAAAELGMEMGSAFFRSTVGSSWPSTRARLLDLYGSTFAVDELRGVAGRIFNELADAHLPLKPGVLELLDQLDGLGMKRAIATTSSHATVRRHLEAYSLASRFHHVVAHDDCERTSLRRIPSSWRRNGWGWRRRFAWRWRIPTTGSARRMRRG